MTYEQFMLSLVMWREGSNQTHAAKVGIGWVIRNRAAHPGWWGKTIVEVIVHKWQFTSMTGKGDPNLLRWPTEEDPSWIDAQAAATEAMDQQSTDPTNGAVDYYSPPLTAPPAAWGPVKEVAVIDALHFCVPA
jgi:N-acetylmuramoyl-L-alanine amidase